MTWDEYYLGICNAVAKNSKCLSRQIGAILVRDKSIISTGYCGPPRNVPHCGTERLKVDDELVEALTHKSENSSKRLPNYSSTCPRQVLGYKSGEGLEWCISGHAERNSLINAARNGIATRGTTMYMTCGTPCKDCTIEIINAGVVEVVVTALSQYDRYALSRLMFESSGVKLRLYKHLEEGK